MDGAARYEAGGDPRRPRQLLKTDPGATFMRREDHHQPDQARLHRRRHRAVRLTSEAATPCDTHLGRQPSATFPPRSWPTRILGRTTRGGARGVTPSTASSSAVPERRWREDPMRPANWEYDGIRRLRAPAANARPKGEDGEVRAELRAGVYGRWLPGVREEMLQAKSWRGVNRPDAFKAKASECPARVDAPQAQVRTSRPSSRHQVTG